MTPAALSRSGFVLPVVLGLILLAALMAVESTGELGGASLLATQRQMHQRAFEAAEAGIAVTLDQLASGVRPTSPQAMPARSDNAGAASVITSAVSSVALPAGFSADRVVEVHYEIRSTGHGARSSDVTVVQGARQLQPVTTP